MTSIVSRLDASAAVRELLGWLLGEGRTDAVLTPRRLPEDGSCDLALLTAPEGLDRAEPLLPVMTTNAGQALSHLSLAGRRLTAVLKPCELRAFTERVKREQGSFERLLTVSAVCGGVFPLGRVFSDGPDVLAAAALEAARRGETPAGVRETCAACEHFVPTNADILVSSGEDGCRIHLCTPRAEEALEGFGGERVDTAPDPARIERVLAARRAARAELYRTLPAEGGLDGLIDLFGRCVGCHGCSRVCPICYCLLCDFESAGLEGDLPRFRAALDERGGLRLPSGTILFHLGRMTHMSFSCVGCGMCSDACPAGIPVAAVFGRTGGRTAALFDYVPGRDAEEPVPVTVFREEELGDIG